MNNDAITFEQLRAALAVAAQALEGTVEESEIPEQLRQVCESSLRSAEYTPALDDVTLALLAFGRKAAGRG